MADVRASHGDRITLCGKTRTARRLRQERTEVFIACPIPLYFNQYRGYWWGLFMRYHFDPDELQILRRAFDAAWQTLEKEAGTTNLAALRDHVGCAIVHFAANGRLEEARLASLAAYQGRRFMGRSVASISVSSQQASP